MGAFALAGALLALAIGVLPLAGPMQAGLLALLLGGVAWFARRQPRLACALVLLMLLLWGWGLLNQPRPGANDPVQRIPANAMEQPVAVTARLLEDPQLDPSGQRCRALAALAGGRSELQFSPCGAFRQGWRLQLQGVLRRLPPAPHPLLAGPAERLQRREAWSALRVESWRVLERQATPVADLRRRMAAALQTIGGPDAGGVLSALVLGSAVSPLTSEVREAFRAAGLSHALAASGYHLTVLLGAMMLVARGLVAPLRWALALGAMAGFLLLAGPQPSVVRAVLMGAVAFALQESGRCSRPLAVMLLCLLLMLVIRPAWLLDVGFQLSAAATAGLILSARPLEQQLQRWGPPWAAGSPGVPVDTRAWSLPVWSMTCCLCALRGGPVWTVGSAAPVMVKWRVCGGRDGGAGGCHDGRASPGRCGAGHCSAGAPPKTRGGHGSSRRAAAAAAALSDCPSHNNAGAVAAR